MVNYGSGTLGDATISTNTTESQPILEYRNLTVEDGVTYTLPSRSRLQVTETLTIDGTIRLQPDISGGGGGGGNGGASGGNLELIARTIEGAGTIDVSGAKGGNTNARGNNSSGSHGVPYEIPVMGVTGSGGNSGGHYVWEREHDGTSNNNGHGNGTGGSSRTGMYEDSNIKAYFEDYLISGAYITQGPFDTLLPGAGGGGSGGGSRNFQPTHNGNTNDTQRVRLSGAGGGPGGSFVTRGGTGGNSAQGNGSRQYDSNDVNDANSTAHHTVQGGAGGGGGGAGGFLLLVSEKVSEDVLIDATGGDGGHGWYGRYQPDGSNYQNDDRIAGGGGGGGAGGLIIAFTDIIPRIDVTGGVGGPDGSNAAGNTGNANFGNEGQNGATFTFSVADLQ